MDPSRPGRGFKVDAFKHTAGDDEQRHTSQPSIDAPISTTQNPSSSTRSESSEGITLPSLDTQFAMMFPDINDQSGAIPQNHSTGFDDEWNTLLGRNNLPLSAYGTMPGAPFQSGRITDRYHSGWQQRPHFGDPSAFRYLSAASQHNGPERPYVLNAPAPSYQYDLPEPLYLGRGYGDTLLSNTYTPRSASQLQLQKERPSHNAATSEMPTDSHNAQRQRYGQPQPLSYVENDMTGYRTASEAEYWPSQVKRKPGRPVEISQEFAGVSLTSGVKAYQTPLPLKPDESDDYILSVPLLPGAPVSLDHDLGKVQTPALSADTERVYKPGLGCFHQRGVPAEHGHLPDVRWSEVDQTPFMDTFQSGQVPFEPQDSPFEVSAARGTDACLKTDQTKPIFGEAYPPAVVDSIDKIWRAGDKLHSSLVRSLEVRRAHNELLGGESDMGKTASQFAAQAAHVWSYTSFPWDHHFDKALDEESTRKAFTRPYQEALGSDNLAAVHELLGKRYQNLDMFSTKGKTLDALRAHLDQIEPTRTPMPDPSHVVSARFKLKKQFVALYNLQKDCSRVGLKQIQAEMEAFKDAVKTFKAPAGVLLSDPYASQKANTTPAQKSQRSSVRDTSSVTKSRGKSKKNSKRSGTPYDKDRSSRRGRP